MLEAPQQEPGKINHLDALVLRWRLEPRMATG